ncbi:MAG: hypothetical protein J5823_05315 [Paludibacteraceae bacterium]|nr:hypothetical protein [Paludibacteraceae bacterium]
MKKSLLYILAILFTANVLSGCRQRGDVYLDPNDEMNMLYTTYAKQFDVIWRGMNTHYVFWSEDQTDWDKVYTTMYPMFARLDSMYDADGTVVDSVSFVKLYAAASAQLIDHHLLWRWKDVHSGKVYDYMPGKAEVAQRDYVYGSKYNRDSLKAAISNYENIGLLGGGRWGEMNDHENYFGLLNMENGKRIAYLWQDGFDMYSTLDAKGTNEKESQYITNVKRWLEYCTTDSQLGGIILDNRFNSGGKVRDLELVIGAFIQEPLHYADLRYKEGAGRYEYSDWYAATVDTCTRFPRRDLAAENIPYVVLVNANSISLGEASAQVAKMLPTGYVIGERTFGAHGQLTSLSTYFHDGTFGKANGKHYVYTSSMQTRFVGEPLLEGIGITPNKEIIQRDNGLNAAMAEAVAYIKEKQSAAPTE